MHASSAYPHDEGTSTAITIADIPNSLKVYRTTSSVRKRNKTANRKMGDYLGDASVTYFIRRA